jgi:hypothetical protein
MTAIAKFLVFVTLVLGVGAAVFATAVFTQRPPWFEPDPGAVAKGQVVYTFDGLKKETAAAGQAAMAASGVWGKNLDALKAAETLYSQRLTKYGQLLALARTGDPNGFFVLDEETGPERRLNLDKRDTPVLGPSGTPLKGAETYLDPLQRSADRIAKDLTPKIEKHRADQKTLGEQIDLFYARLVRQRAILANLRDQAAYLAATEINVAGEQKTAERRQKQLADRLKAFAPKQLD